MKNQPRGYDAKGMVLVIILVLAVLAATAWQLGLFDSGTDEEMRPVYKIDVVDESGGELIVTDPDAPSVEDLQLPETPMTPLPPGEAADTAATATPTAD